MPREGRRREATVATSAPLLELMYTRPRDAAGGDRTMRSPALAVEAAACSLFLCARALCRSVRAAVATALGGPQAPASADM